MLCDCEMATDYVLDAFDTSDYALNWNKEKTRAHLENKYHSVTIHTDVCKVNFGFRDSGTSFTMMILESDDSVFIGVFNKIKKTLEQLAPEHPISGFIKYNEASIGILAKIPIDKKRRICVDIYDDDGKKINERANPTLTVEDLRSRYHLHPGLANVTLQISGISLWDNRYFVSVFVQDMYVHSMDPVDDMNTVDLRNITN